MLIRTKNGGFLLEVKPTYDTPGAIYRVNQEVFEEGANGVELKELFKKFGIEQNFEKISTTYKRKLPSKPKDTPNKFYGRGFIAIEDNNKYFLEYELAYHGGGNRRFEISKEIYKDARTGKYTTTDLFEKYNLYHKDVPENDVQ